MGSNFYLKLKIKIYKNLKTTSQTKFLRIKTLIEKS